MRIYDQSGKRTKRGQRDRERERASARALAIRMGETERERTRNGTKWDRGSGARELKRICHYNS